MSNNSDIPKQLDKPNKGIVHLNNIKSNEEFYYPPESYIEDFEIDKIEILQLLENFEPTNIDN